MFRVDHIRSGVSALALSLASMPLAATFAPAHAATAQSYSFAIPAQNLASALRQYSRTTGIQIAASADTLRGRRSAGVSGTLTAEAALERIISGAGVAVQRQGSTIIVTEAAATLTHAAQSNAATGAGQVTGPEGQDIVVTGYRESLDVAIAEKRIGLKHQGDDAGNRGRGERRAGDRGEIAG